MKVQKKNFAIQRVGTEIKYNKTLQCRDKEVSTGLACYGKNRGIRQGFFFRIFFSLAIAPRTRMAYIKIYVNEHESRKLNNTHFFFPLNFYPSTEAYPFQYSFSYYSDKKQLLQNDILTVFCANSILINCGNEASATLKNVLCVNEKIINHVLANSLEK